MSGCSGGSLKSKYKYPEIIFRLEAFITNHEAIKGCRNDIDLFCLLGIKVTGDLDFLKFHLTNGLCALIFGNSEGRWSFIVVDEIKRDAFKSWSGFSGSVAYPVGGAKEYAKIENIADNPKRLDLAKHLLEEFKKVKA